MFRFKQFTIHQDQCAMKVCTDNCLFGAWLAALPVWKDELSCMDVGAGTGLLSLMLAQARPSWQIAAVEVDAATAEQAKRNVWESPFAAQVSVVERDVLTMELSQQVDLLVSNPPFYEAQLASPDAGRNLAHHSSQLTLDSLLKKAIQLVRPGGQLALLFPFYRKEELLAKLTQNGWTLTAVAQVRQHPGRDFFRVMVVATKQEMPVEDQDLIEEDIVIKEADGQYSSRFQELLRPYYLYL